MNSCNLTSKKIHHHISVISLTITPLCPLHRCNATKIIPNINFAKKNDRKMLQKQKNRQIYVHQHNMRGFSLFL